LATCNRTTPIRGDSAVVAAGNETTARDKNILKRISTIRADFQHTAVEADIGIHLGGLKIEVMLECQLGQHRL
jgi:environmental stress-induced protein Ves